MERILFVCQTAKSKHRRCMCETAHAIGFDMRYLSSSTPSLLLQRIIYALSLAVAPAFGSPVVPVDAGAPAEASNRRCPRQPQFLLVALAAQLVRYGMQPLDGFVLQCHAQRVPLRSVHRPVLLLLRSVFVDKSCPVLQQSVHQPSPKDGKKEARTSVFR